MQTHGKMPGVSDGKSAAPIASRSTLGIWFTKESDVPVMVNQKELDPEMTGWFFFLTN